MNVGSGSKIDVHTVLKLIALAITATYASSGARSGVATSSTCNDLRGSLSPDSSPSNMACSSRSTYAPRYDSGMGSAAISSPGAFDKIASRISCMRPNLPPGSNPTPSPRKYSRSVAGGDDMRVRLEAQAAAIVGKARAEAAQIVAEANGDSERVRAEAEAALNRARRELVQAQEQALAVRADATHQADSIVRNAHHRARAEADELLRDAQRRLARVLDEAHIAEARARAARIEEDRAKENVEQGVVALPGEPLDEMVAGAVRAAVRRAVHPVVVRAGRYTVIER